MGSPAHMRPPPALFLLSGSTPPLSRALCFGVQSIVFRHARERLSRRRASK
jgi:hypothetical protein